MQRRLRDFPTPSDFAHALEHGSPSIGKSASTSRVSLRRKLTCPHCWHLFPPEDILWVSEHTSLLGDAKLGDSEFRRFLPSRFNATGNAKDAAGTVCTELACPNCHLVIPRVLLETAPLFVSTIGAPSSGKTYFTVAMIQQLRESLPKFFQSSLTDADPNANRVLNDYVERQFLSADRKRVTRLPKTEEHGELYKTVAISDRTVTLPMPFVFNVGPLAAHPNSDIRKKVSRVICLYDNAGESFQPGKDSGDNLSTDTWLEVTLSCSCLIQRRMQNFVRRANHTRWTRRCAMSL